MPTRKSARKKPARDYANLHAGLGLPVVLPGGGGGSTGSIGTTSSNSNGINGDAGGSSGNGAGARWASVLARADLAPDAFRRMKGEEVALAWLETDTGAMREPVVVCEPEGLGMQMPRADLTVGEIAEMLGAETPVEVIGASPLLLVG